MDEPDELDEVVAWVRARGPQPLPLDGWDQASIWGWNEAAGSLYAHLWRNTDDPGGPPAIRIEPGEYTPPITWPETLSQYVAMALDLSPWTVDTVIGDMVEVIGDMVEQDRDRAAEDRAATPTSPGTTVTMLEGHGIWWPPDSGAPLEGPE